MSRLAELQNWLGNKLKAGVNLIKSIDYRSIFRFRMGLNGIEWDGMGSNWLRMGSNRHGMGCNGTEPDGMGLEQLASQSLEELVA